MAIQPNQDLLDNPAIPRVTLAGREWPVPRLAIAQNIIVGPIIARSQAALRKLGNGSEEAFSEELLRDLAMAAFQALLRGHGKDHGDLKRAEFDEMPIGIAELVDALAVITKQTGTYRAAKAGEPAPLAPTATSPTGTP